MLCKNPYMKGVTPFPCGQCLPCRLNRRRLWTSRLLLEQRSHEESSFWTFTYDDENLPENGSLVPADARNLLKRIRALAAPGRLRFYLVGEYGDRSLRPHYHAALFGLGRDSDLPARAWKLGFVYPGDLNLNTAQYIAGYVTKKMTKPDDPRLPPGCVPEFARMSLRPGIGALAVGSVADSLNDSHGARFVGASGDVPISLRHGGRSLPLGRYLRQKLRDEMGIDEPIKYKSFTDEMQTMLDSSLSPRDFARSKPFIERTKIRQIEGKSKIFSKKESI